MSILVSGSFAYDYIMDFPDSFKNHILPEQIHILNVCFVVDKLERRFGGTAGNIAYTVKMLGGEPIAVSALGQDGAVYRDYLQKNGIITDCIIFDNNQMSASAHITTDSDDNQITAFFNGPLRRGLEIDITKNNSTFILISPTHKDVMTTHLNAAADAGKIVVFDPGQQLTAFSDIELTKLVSRARYVIGNDYEIKLLSDRTGLSVASMAEAGKTVIITLGAKGSLISTPDGEIIEIAPCTASSVDDPTGAGDAYRAGFFVALERGLSLKVAGQMGAVAASYAIEKYGTQTHRFTLVEFSERYERYCGEKLGYLP